jgi:hypothetical protein
VPAICTLSRRPKSCSRKGNDCNQQQRPLAGANAATNSQAFIPGSADRTAPTETDAPSGLVMNTRDYVISGDGASPPSLFPLGPEKSRAAGGFAMNAHFVQTSSKKEAPGRP